MRRTYVTANGMTMVLIFLSRVYCFGNRDSLRQPPFDPLKDLHPADLVAHFGYPVERHWVTTEDGYVLSVQRIPRGKEEGGGDWNSRPVAILGHGFLSTTIDWLLLGPGKSLAFLLADAGYDVWMPNFRGNMYSRNHTELDPDQDPEFWDFSYHELGVYDLPATIEYVVGATGQDQVHYVGYSMGGGAMFIAATQRPDAARRVKLFTTMAPGTSIQHLRSKSLILLGLISLIVTSPEKLTGTTIIGAREILPATAARRRFREALCGNGRITQGLCVALWHSFFGSNPKQENRTLLPAAFAQFPNGSSFKTFIHYCQTFLRGFAHYDYGALENLRRYGIVQTPPYDVRRVTIPVQVFYGENDLTVDALNARELCSLLRNVRYCLAMPDPLWTHLNFMHGIDAHVLYRKIIADMDAFECEHGGHCDLTTNMSSNRSDPEVTEKNTRARIR